MNTKIKLTHNGQEYILEYDRMSVKLLESSGFVLDEFLEKPMSNIELAFAGAFIKNHKKTPQATIDELYNGCKNKTELVTTLSKISWNISESKSIHSSAILTKIFESSNLTK